MNALGHSTKFQFGAYFQLCAFSLCLTSCGVATPQRTAQFEAPSKNLGSVPTNPEVFHAYMSSRDQKAYAIGSNGIAGAGVAFSTIAEAKDVALNNCRSAGGVDCEIESANGREYPRLLPMPDAVTSGSSSDSDSPGKPPANGGLDTNAILSSGTGFIVNNLGELITNAHVVEGCKKLEIRQPPKSYPASLKALDKQNDLALLETQSDEIRSAARLVGSRRVRVGERVIVFGYPLSSVLSTQPKLTDGILSAMAGIGDDSRYYQISAPIQPGSSGGPLFDSYGAVMGVITSSLSDIWGLKNQQAVPQGVNFALKAATVKAFLEANGSQFTDQNTTQAEMPNTEIAELAKSVTVQVLCLG